MTKTIKLSSPETRDFWELEILFEDDSVLALSKPPGLWVCPDPMDGFRPNLMGLAHAGIERGTAWAKERGLTYLANAHRLDEQTSGVILLAKTKTALVSLSNQFNAEKPTSGYIALVRGGPLEDDFSVDLKLAPHPTRPGVLRPDPEHGKKAFTEFHVLERFAGFTLIECRPFTERPHQIRVHLHARSLPVVGDKLYGGKALFLSRLKKNYRLKPDKEERPLLSRPALHAGRLNLTHPVTGAPLEIQCPPAKDISVAIRYLRRYASGGPELPASEPQDAGEESPQA